MTHAVRGGAHCKSIMRWHADHFYGTRSAWVASALLTTVLTGITACPEASAPGATNELDEFLVRELRTFVIRLRSSRSGGMYDVNE